MLICLKNWQNYLRMDESMYFKLLLLVTPFIGKNDAAMRRVISPYERLTAAPRFLATERSYIDLKFLAIISPQALSYITLEICNANYQVLRQES